MKLFYTGKNKGMCLFIYELLIIDFVRTDECVLNQAQLLVNSLFLVVLITITIILQFVCTCDCSLWSIPHRACS